MPTNTFDAFRAELQTLKNLIKAIDTKTLRNELLLERFRTLFRTWVATIQEDLHSQLENKKDFLKLSAELESLAKLTSKFKPVNEYRKRLNRALTLANSLVIYLPQPALQRIYLLSPVEINYSYPESLIFQSHLCQTN